MQKILLLALFCLAVVSAQKGSKKLWWSDTKSLLLKSGNFLDHVGKEKIVIVQFVAQFSRECQALLPEWDKLALMYHGDNPKRSDVTVALIDGWTSNSISQSYGVTAFPSIIIFGKGDAQTQTVYKGEKKADKISEWIEQFANGQIPADKPNNAADANTNTQANADSNSQASTPPPAQDQQPPAQEPQAATQTPPAQEPPAQQAQTPPPAAAEPVQTPPPAQQAPPQPVEPRDVNVVLNTSLLQTQFEELQKHTTTLNDALQRSINDNFQRFENLKGLMDTHRDDLTKVGNNVLSHNQRFEEVKQSLQNHKNEIHRSVTEHTQQQIDDLKNTINQIKNKVFERRVEEPKEESTFGSSTVMFIVGGLIGAAVTFVVVSAQGGRNKRKLLID